MTAKKHTAVDLFAGAGGLSVGLKNAGFRVPAAVELDPTSAASYVRNHPRTYLANADIRKLTGPALLKLAGLRKGELSLLTGCPPCQGFSTLRTRRRASSMPDPRNELIFEVLRIVRSTAPRAILIENVPGLVDDWRFAEFLRGLTRCGYEHDFRILDAQDYGVPQRRTRVVLLALRGEEVPTKWFHHRCPPTTVRDVIAGLPKAGISGDPIHDLPERRSHSVMARICATPKNGGSQGDLPENFRCPCHRRSNGYFDVYGRMSWDQVAPTITSGCHNPSKGRFLHPDEDRAITLREAALLQTFPPSYEFDLSRGKEHVAWQIGNAFPPRLVEPIARNLIKILAA